MFICTIIFRLRGYIILSMGFTTIFYILSTKLYFIYGLLENKKSILSTRIYFIYILLEHKKSIWSTGVYFIYIHLHNYILSTGLYFIYWNKRSRFCLQDYILGQFPKSISSLKNYSSHPSDDRLGSNANLSNWHKPWLVTVADVQTLCILHW